MPTSVSTFAAGATIDADALRTRAQTIERYVNNEIAAGDRTTNWMKSGHVYAPDFQYGVGSGPHLPLTGGHAYWSHRPNDDSRRAIFSYLLGEGVVMVPGLTRTVQTPESLTTKYRAVAMASFWVYEYGGDGTNAAGPGYPVAGTPQEPLQDEYSDVAATVALYGGTQTPIEGTERDIYTASCATDNSWAGGYGATSGIIYCRKQITMVSAFLLAKGVSHVGVGVSTATPTGDKWKHIFVREGSFYLRYRFR